MSIPALQHERQVALAAVRQAATLCRAVQQQVSPGTLKKKDRSPVTVADFGSQALVCRALQAAFPQDTVIAEEDAAVLRQPDHEALFAQVVAHVQRVIGEGDAEQVGAWIDHGGAKAQADRFWTLDPIDGTKGFLRGEQYAVALALIAQEEVVLAALACPNLPVSPGAQQRGVAYLAVKDQGTVQVPLWKEGPSTPVQVSRQSATSGARFCESVESGHSSHGDAATIAQVLGITAPPVRLDSQAKYAVVARGEADIYMRLPTRPGYIEKIWDHAAGALVVEEAGGQVTDVHGRRLAFRYGHQLKANKGVIVSNGTLHAPLIDALRSLYPDPD